MIGINFHQPDVAEPLDCINVKSGYIKIKSDAVKDGFRNFKIAEYRLDLEEHTGIVFPHFLLVKMRLMTFLIFLEIVLHTTGRGAESLVGPAFKRGLTILANHRWFFGSEIMNGLRYKGMLKNNQVATFCCNKNMSNFHFTDNGDGSEFYSAQIDFHQK